MMGWTAGSRAALTDPARLTTLDSYAILDTPPEPGFDDIVLLATRACATPVALISLVDRDRQWFKARVGFEPCETDIERSVCHHALAQADLLVIPDLTLDPRTRENPLVTGEPRIRFYAGAPLVVMGAVVGTLCVIDGEPRPDGLTEVQRSTLEALARQVVTQLEIRRALAERDIAMTGERRERQQAVTAALSTHGLNIFGPHHRRPRVTPTEIKAKVEDAHRRAMSNAFMQMSRESGVRHLLRDVKLYGRDAGTDFVETNLSQIVQEAVSMAECKRASLEIPAYGFGKAAVAGMARALEDLTALKVEVKGNVLHLIWSQPNPGYV